MGPLALGFFNMLRSAKANVGTGEGGDIYGLKLLNQSLDDSTGLCPDDLNGRGPCGDYWFLSQKLPMRLVSYLF